MKAWMYIVGAIVLVLVAGGGGFFAGTVYAQNQAQAAATNFARSRAVGENNQNGQNAQAQGPCGFAGAAFAGGNGGNRNFGNGNSTNGNSGADNANGNANGNTQRQNALAQLGNCVARGQVKSVDPSTGLIEITTPVNVVTVKVDTTTQISKTDLGTIQDLKPGDRVTVFSKDSGDSPTASVIQLQNGLGLPAGQ